MLYDAQDHTSPKYYYTLILYVPGHSMEYSHCVNVPNLYTGLGQRQYCSVKTSKIVTLILFVGLLTGYKQKYLSKSVNYFYIDLFSGIFSELCYTSFSHSFSLMMFHLWTSRLSEHVILD